MATWLLATELGGGLGHLTRLRVLAAALSAPGDRTVLLCSDPAAASSVFAGLAEIRRSPPLALDANRIEGDYPSILSAFGFADGDRLAASVAAWNAVFDTVRPDALIADHAPFAIFAARGRLPAAVIGSGFDLPPAGEAAFPPLMPDAPAIDHAQMLAAVRQAAAAHGRPAPDGLPAAVAGDARFLVGLPWIDPYWRRRPEEALGPLGARPPVEPAPADGHVFAYLNPDAAMFDSAVRALASLPMRCSAFWTGGGDAQRALLARLGVTIFDRPPDPAAVLPQATLVLSHGGAGLAADAIFAGRAQLCLPLHREGALNAAALGRLGVGRACWEMGSEAIAGEIMRAAEDLAMRDAALALGLAAHRRYPHCPAAIVARGIRHMAGCGGRDDRPAFQRCG